MKAFERNTPGLVNIVPFLQVNIAYCKEMAFEVPGSPNVALGQISIHRPMDCMSLPYTVGLWASAWECSKHWGPYLLVLVPSKGKIPVIEKQEHAELVAAFQEQRVPSCNPSLGKTPL